MSDERTERLALRGQIARIFAEVETLALGAPEWGGEVHPGNWQMADRVLALLSERAGEREPIYNRPHDFVAYDCKGEPRCRVCDRSRADTIHGGQPAPYLTAVPPDRLVCGGCDGPFPCPEHGEAYPDAAPEPERGEGALADLKGSGAYDNANDFLDDLATASESLSEQLHDSEATAVSIAMEMLRKVLAAWPEQALVPHDFSGYHVGDVLAALDGYWPDRGSYAQPTDEDCFIVTAGVLRSLAASPEPGEGREPDDDVPPYAALVALTAMLRFMSDRVAGGEWCEAGAITIGKLARRIEELEQATPPAPAGEPVELTDIVAALQARGLAPIADSKGGRAGVWLDKADMSALVAPPAPAGEECEWRNDGDGNYESTCGGMWTFITGGPEENRVVFCPYCGEKVHAPQDATGFCPHCGNGVLQEHSEGCPRATGEAEGDG